MSRTLEAINAELDTTVEDVFDQPSASNFADWRLWRNIFARAILTFEVILDLHKNDVEDRIARKQPGTLSWYYDRVLEFQGAEDSNGYFQGDELIVDEFGVIRYQVPDTTRRIIAQASLSESGGDLVIKVAKKLDENNFQALNGSEQTAFNLYISNVKYPGTGINVISQNADIIKYDLNVYYDPIYTTGTIQANLAGKMNEYRSSLGFDDKFYVERFIEKLLEAEGVVSVKHNQVQIKTATSGVFAPIDVVAQLESGYFNYSPEDDPGDPSVINLINFKTLF